MGSAAFAIMIVVPILEIAVFILVGRTIGLWPTLVGILSTTLIGTMIIRHQGIGLIAEARKSIAAGEPPMGEVLEGLALLAAGVLLITPGFITDVLGFLVLVPSIRRRLAGMILTQATRRAEMQARAARAAAESGGGGARPGGRSGAPMTIEGEWREVEPGQHDDVDQPQPGRGWGTSRRPAADEDDADELPPAKRAGG